MGGKPLTCLNLAGFPTDQLPLRVLAEILKGGAERVQIAGATLVGGHTIDDHEPKYGLAVTGIVHPQRILRNSGAQAGDLLILTKPLGIGITVTAMKRMQLPGWQVEAAVNTMVALNQKAAEVALKYGAHACTDVTGFGFLGHLHEMATGSGLSMEVWADRVPVLRGSHELAEQGFICGGSKANRSHAEQFATYVDTPETLQVILTDAITSGGLLMAIPPAQAENALSDLHQRGITEAAVVGRAVNAPSGRTYVHCVD